MASQSLAQNKPLLNFSHAPAILPHSMGQVLSDPNCASFQSSALAREIYDVFTFINQTCIFNATLSNIRFLPSCSIFFFHSFLSSSSHPFFLNKSIYQLRSLPKFISLESFSKCICVCILFVAQPCLTLLQPHGVQPTGLLCPLNLPGKNTRVGCHFLLQGIFPTQVSNLSWQADSLPLSCQGSPLYLLSYLLLIVVAIDLSF